VKPALAHPDASLPASSVRIGRERNRTGLASKGFDVLRLQIDDRQITAQPGQTVLQAARAAGIVIPTLCYHPDLSPVGSCRMCLVEEQNLDRKTAACTLLARPGMVIHTSTPQIVEHRRFVLRLLLANYVHDPQTPREANELLHWAREYQVELLPEGMVAARYSADSDPSPVIRVNMNQCILCTRCIRVCAEVQGRFVWHLADKGHETRVVPGVGTTMDEARCEACGACAAYCPTGALADRFALGLDRPDRLVRTTCAYCGVGCQFDLNVKDERVVRVTSSPDAPVNGMSLCVKGRYGFDYVHHPDRLTRPRVRRYLLDGQSPASPEAAKASPWAEVEWPTALSIVALRLAQIRGESGPGAIGLLASAKCTNEENYLVQKLARQVIGTNNVDHCARLCHSSTVAGLTMCFGSGAMSNSMDDLAEHAAGMFVIGSNTTEQHPVFGAMIRQAVLRRGMKLIVADPRQIDLTEFATLHLRHRPGTDVALLNGLMHLILRNGWHDPAFIAERCEEFNAFAASLGRYQPDVVSPITGVSAEQLLAAAEILGTHHPAAAVWAMGITQHTTGVLNVLALGNLQMLLGNMGKPGGGVNPLRGQNNVQGACDMGALPNVLPGYQPVSDANVMTNFAAAWAVAASAEMSASPAGWPSNPGLTVTEMIEAAGKGELRALYILGEDPAMTEPDSNHTRRSLAACEFVVLQEIFPSETAAYADVLLPGAAFAEKDGTFTNTERRVQLICRAIDAPGQARPDWRIIAEIGRQTLESLRLLPTGPHAGWDYASPADIMREIAAVTPSYAGVNHQRLERGERLQWPVLDEHHPGTPILHVGTFTRGKGRFHVVDHLPPHELPDADYPLLLTTGRVLYHWHGGELSRRSAALLAEYPEPLVEISPEDAARLRLSDGTSVRVVSRRGEMVARAAVTERVAGGIVFGNFHFPGLANVNNLTIRALDPIAKIPEYKVCAVRIEPGATGGAIG
jgi:formate dehydrogenase alpha subunit